MKKNKAGNRKFNRKHFAAAAGAGLTAAAVLITAVFSRTIEAEAADTLIGIEKLRTRVKESGREYVILEVVPGRTAAEIGFLFKDFEPILSEWDYEKMEWNKWENILCSLPSYEERRQYIEDKKEELRAYYAQAGLSGAYPVEPESGEYEESDEPASGFKKITSDSVERTGWFERTEPGDYQVSFTYRGNFGQGYDEDILHYTVKYAVSLEELSDDDIAKISEDTFIYYVPEGQDGNNVYVCAGTWGNVGEKALKFIMDKADEGDGQEDSDKDDGKDKDGGDGSVSGNDSDEEDGDTGEGDGDDNTGDGNTEDGGDTGDGDGNTEDGGDTGAGDGNVDNGGDTGAGDGNVDNGSDAGEGDGNVEDSGNTGSGSGEDSGNIGGGEGNTDSGSVSVGSGNSGQTDSQSGGDSGAGSNDGGNNDSGNGADTTAKASMPLSVNINQGKWFLLAAEEPVSGSDVRNDSGNTGSDSNTSNDNDSEKTGSDNTDSGSGESGNADSENMGSDEGGSGDANDGTPGDDGGYADDMDSDDENTDSEDTGDTDDVKDGEDEDDVTADKSVYAVGGVTGYWLVDFEKVTDYNKIEDDNTSLYSVNDIVESSSGQYKFIEWDEEDEKATHQTYNFPGRTIYCKNTFKSNEWFRKYVLNMEQSDYGDFPVRLLTLTPQELNEMEQLPAFDFLYLNSGLRTWGTESDEGPDISGNDSGSGDGESEKNRVVDSKSDSDDANDNDEFGNGSDGQDGIDGSDEDNKDGKGEAGSDDGDNGGNGESGSGEVGNNDGSDEAGSNAGSNNADSGENSNSADSETGSGSNGSSGGGNVNSDSGNAATAEEGQSGTGVNTEEDSLTVASAVQSGGWTKYVALDADEEGGDDNENEGDNTTGGDEEDEIAGPAYSADNDLSAEVLKYFFDRAIAGAKPCLVDGNIVYAKDENDTFVVNEDLQNTNIFRLSAMLCQDSLSEWYEDHRNNYANLTVKQLMDGIVEDADKNFVTEQVYCRYGDDSIVNDLFSTATIYKEGGEIEPGFQPVLDEIVLENLYREADTSGNYKPLSTDISQAKAVRHILNYGDRRKVETKKNIKVLEIQPAKADESELTLEQLKKWAPGVETAEITVMTTSEFIGKIEKLNENYDLIYIGTSKDHLNMRYWTNKNYTDKPDKDHVAAGTVFNDSDMDGLIYYNIGDLRGAAMMLAGQLDSEYWGSNRNDNVYYYNLVRYPGNDITEEKKEALLSFLDGSYPVIVADDFFESPVTVYATPEYKDGRVNLSEGEYNYNDMVALGIAGGDISAVKVKEGYKVTFYNGWYFEDDPGANRHSVSFTENENNFNNVPYGGGGNWNNKPNSLKVERIGNEVPARKIDEDHIDNCTYMYEFVKKAMDDKYVNFYAWSDIMDESELFKFYLNRPKVSLTDVTVNGEEKEGSGSDVRYIEAGINGKYNLQYSFIIKNEGAASYNTRYQCKLYIDINSDGKFSEQEEISDISVTQGGGNVSPNDLYADRRYVVSREVPSGYKGLLPWKVEITQADNKNIYTSMQGYTKLEGMDPEQIKVIQIGRDRITDVSWEALGWDEDLFNLGAEIEGRTNYKSWTASENYFHTLVYGGWIGDTYYEGITDDFDINVTFMTISEFETRYYGGWFNNEYYEANPNLLDDFNMLILGFSDMYGDFQGDEESGPMGAILDFVNGGKSVLFAHDTTSFFNYPKKGGNFNAFNGDGYTDRSNKGATKRHGDYHNASTLNKYLRNLVGMDRYGVLDSDILRRGQALSEGTNDYNTVVSSRYDVAYKPKSGKKETVPQVHGYTYVVASGKDENKQEFTSNELGTSGTFNNKYTNIRFDSVYYKGNKTDNGEVRDPANGEVDNLYVTQVNQGQITEYPYKLAPKFQVAETHSQYYQLDYTADDDGDGESDLVVWYCLDTRGTGDSAQQTVYSQSPNDVRNNYYIYNKGNITYTGMGHNVHKSGKYTLEEAKLFINTIIAAYQAGIKDPYISVLKKGVPESDVLKTLYRYYDPTNDFSLNDLAATETTEKIYFTVQDINFIKGTRQIATHVFYQVDGGGETITVDGVEIAVNRLADDIYDATTGIPVDANNLASGGIYYILVPRSVMQQCEDGLDLYFEAQSTLTTSTTNENVYVTDKVYAKLKVLQAYLFNLE